MFKYFLLDPFEFPYYFYCMKEMLPKYIYIYIYIYIFSI